MVVAITWSHGMSLTDEKSPFDHYANDLNVQKEVQLSGAGGEMTEKHLYLDVFDTTAYKLAWLVQIPRYVKYL